MFLHSLTLTNFKNHERFALDFTRAINCLIGPNGIGKTNILDAIYYACLTKSYFSATDQQNIRIGADFMRLDAQLSKGDIQLKLVCKLQAAKKKEFIINDLPYKKMSDHIGLMPVVMIAPDDNLLILGGSKERRKFIDNTLSQVDKSYLENLITYNKYLDQRNALLKSLHITGSGDRVLIDRYDEQLVDYGTELYEKRKAALLSIEPLFQYYYQTLSLARELTTFDYDSSLHLQPYATQLKSTIAKDILIERTTTGIHRDDIQFMLAGNKIKRFGSQGQQKSFLIALKLAQYDFIASHHSVKPFLLIDDIFDKIDAERSKQLIKLLSSSHFGQTFITDTSDSHISEELQNESSMHEIFNVNKK